MGKEIEKLSNDYNMTSYWHVVTAVNEIIDRLKELDDFVHADKQPGPKEDELEDIISSVFPSGYSDKEDSLSLQIRAWMKSKIDKAEKNHVNTINEKCSAFMIIKEALGL